MNTGFRAVSGPCSADPRLAPKKCKAIYAISGVSDSCFIDSGTHEWRVIDSSTCPSLVPPVPLLTLRHDDLDADVVAEAGEVGGGDAMSCERILLGNRGSGRPAAATTGPRRPGTGPGHGTPAGEELLQEDDSVHPGGNRSRPNCCRGRGEGRPLTLD